MLEAKQAVDTAKSAIDDIQNAVSDNAMSTLDHRNNAETFRNEAESFMASASGHSGKAGDYAQECETVYNKLLKALQSQVSGTGVVRIEDVNSGMSTAKVECSSSVMMYGKNLTNYDGVNWDGNIVINEKARRYKEIGVPCDVTLSVTRTNNMGNISVYESADDFNTLTSIGGAASQSKFDPIFISKIEGRRYCVVTTSTSTGYFEKIQTEAGLAATDYEEYKNPVELTNLAEVELYSPTATLIASSDAPITATYTKDINRIIERLENAIAT